MRLSSAKSLIQTLMVMDRCFYCHIRLFVTCKVYLDKPVVMDRCSPSVFATQHTANKDMRGYKTSPAKEL